MKNEWKVSHKNVSFYPTVESDKYQRNCLGNCAAKQIKISYILDQLVVKSVFKKSSYGLLSSLLHHILFWTPTFS